MASFQIVVKSTGVDLGVYEAETARAAVEAMWADAGADESQRDADDLDVSEVQS